MKLSILICTLENRSGFLSQLLKGLEPQKNNQVEILVERDQGQITVGEKRNRLLERAQGDYIVFVDDDDEVSANYVTKILESIDKSSPDVIGLHLLMTTNGMDESRTYHSLKYRSWYDEPDPDRPGRKRYFRNPNHLNPVKREKALQIKFPNLNRFEDRDYSTRLLKLLNTEEYIEEPLYFYLYRTLK